MSDKEPGEKGKDKGNEKKEKTAGKIENVRVDDKGRTEKIEL